MFGDVVFKVELRGGFVVHDAGWELIPTQRAYDSPLLGESHELIGGKNVIAGQWGSVPGFGIGLHGQRQLELRATQPSHRPGRALASHVFNGRFADLDVRVLQVNASVFHLLDGGTGADHLCLDLGIQLILQVPPGRPVGVLLKHTPKQVDGDLCLILENVRIARSDEMNQGIAQLEEGGIVLSAAMMLSLRLCPSCLGGMASARKAPLEKSTCNESALARSCWALRSIWRRWFSQDSWKPASGSGFEPVVFVERTDRQSSTAGANSLAIRAASRLWNNLTTDAVTFEKSSFDSAAAMPAGAGDTRRHRTRTVPADMT